MPTLPHEARAMAESFGADAERYDRARPDYPAAMVEAIVAAAPGPDVLDVGCGTGISARAFQSAGCRVLGVDVDERMAAFARRRGLEVEVATFEAWDPAGRTFDAVVSGQAWHWVDPGAGAAKAATVLRPAGRLAAFWNVFQAPDDLAAAFSAVYRRVVPDWPRNPWARRGLEAFSPILGKVEDGIRQAGAFGDPAQWRFAWARPYTRDAWLEQMQTSGDAGQFPPGALEALMEGSAQAIDAAGGSFTMAYTSVVVTAARR